MAAGQTKAETAPAGDKPDTKKRLGRGLSALLGDTNALRRQTAEREGCATIFNPLEGAQPDDADSAITDQTLLAELRFANPCAPGAVDGVLTFDPIAATTAIAAGTASWYRALGSDGSTVVMDGTVDVSENSPNLVFPVVDLVIGATVIFETGPKGAQYAGGPVSDPVQHAIWAMLRTALLSAIVSANLPNMDVIATYDSAAEAATLISL